jgi:hypothetical protein
MEVRYPGFGTIEVEGRRFDADVVIDGGTVRRRDKGPSRGKRPGHTPLSAAEDLPWSGDRLIVGTGYSGMLPVLDDVYREAANRGVELVAVPTEQACTLIRGILPEAVHAVLHVTC